MKRVTLYIVFILSMLSCGNQEDTCSDNEIKYGEINCINREQYTFYEAAVDFYCFDRSILLGVDLDRMVVSLDYISTYNAVNKPIMISAGFFDLNLCTRCSKNHECYFDGKYGFTWLRLDEDFKEQIQGLPSEIKVNLIHTVYLEPDSEILDQQELVFRRRDD